MRPQRDPDEYEVPADNAASFFPMLAFTRLNNDPEDRHILHEMSHVLTFAQTQFYADFAARAIIARPPPFRNLLPIFEIVPQLLADGGERHSPGTTPDRHLCDKVRHCLEVLNHDLDRSGWRDVLRGYSAAGLAAGIPAQKVFNRSFVIALIQVAVDLHASGGWQSDPCETLGFVCSNFAARSRAHFFRNVRTLQEIIKRVVHLPDPPGVKLLNDQALLSHVFTEASLERLVENISLVPAIARVEFFVYSENNLITASFFSKPSKDYDLRKGVYTFERRCEEFSPQFFKSELNAIDRAMIAEVAGGICTVG